MLNSANLCIFRLPTSNINFAWINPVSKPCGLNAYYSALTFFHVLFPSLKPLYPLLNLGFPR
jgi:hypothetical protein